MYKLSDLIGKEAITLSDAKKQGVVLNAHFDEALRQCKYFTLINHDEEVRWVDCKNVLSLENDAVVIRSSDDISEAAPCCTVPSPINLKAFNQDGAMMGFVRDVEIENGKTAKFITETGEIASLTLLSISDEILVFNDTGKPVKIKPAKKQPEKAAESSGAESSATESSQKPPEKTAKITAVEPKENQKESQTVTSIHKIASVQDIQKIPQNNTAVHRSPTQQQQAPSKYSFLLGKRLQRNIYDSKGAVIARENDLITQPLILRAKESGKLVTLALHSL